jgi:hypothetical protein
MIRTLSLAAAGVVILAACGGSTAGSGAGPTTSSPAPAAAAQPPGTTSGSSAGEVPVKACALLGDAQVVRLLGGATAGIPAGTEQDYSGTYKICRWSSNPDAAHPNVASVDVAFFKKSKATDNGLSRDANYGPPEAVSGVGDDATFAKSGYNVELIANKGLWSIELAASAALTDPSLKTYMVEKVQKIFTLLGV